MAREACLVPPRSSPVRWIGLMEPVVRLRSVVALLGGFPALAGADLTVDAGEAVLLRGPNGAGKSTVLRVCAGLIPVARGEAWVLGADLTKDRRSIRRRIAMLGHAGFLYDDLTRARERHLRGVGCRRRQGRDRRCAGAAWSRRATRDTTGRCTVGWSTPPHGSGRTRRAQRRAVVARRAARWS